MKQGSTAVDQILEYLVFGYKDLTEVLLMYARLSALLLSTLILAPSLSAQPAAPYTPPRTEYGTPDLQGVWGVRFNTLLERPVRQLECRARLGELRVERRLMSNVLRCRWRRRCPDRRADS